MKYRLREVWENYKRLHPDKKHLGYRQIAEASGVPLSNIQRVAANRNVTIETLEKLATFFGVKVRDLLNED